MLTANAPADLAPVDPVVIRAGRARGVLTGGNLATLCHLVWTDFAPDFSEKIVLLEDVNEASYRIDRMLTQMRLAGCFENMAGIALGSFKDCGAREEVLAVIEDVCADFKGPILGGFEIGHGNRNLAVPVGVNAEVDTEEGVLRFL